MTVKRLFRLFKNGIKYIFNRKYRFTVDTYRGKYVKLSDEDYVKLATKVYFEKEIDLDNPVTFNEKLQWLKLYDRKPQYTTMVDKYLAKKYVADIIGERYIIPTLGVWDSPDEINFDILPNEFVLKCNHDSGGLYICKDKQGLSTDDICRVKQTLKKFFETDYYRYRREWPYKDIKRKIIAEQYMVDESGYELKDYKIYCFNGEPRMILVCKNRFGQGGHTEDYYDLQWNHLPIRQADHMNSTCDIPVPECLSEMIVLAKKLSIDTKFVRVDFYVVQGKIYFGELTFFPASGFFKFIPKTWDEKLGRLIVLPEKTVED